MRRGQVLELRVLEEAIRRALKGNGWPQPALGVFATGGVGPIGLLSELAHAARTLAERQKAGGDDVLRGKGLRWA